MKWTKKPERKTVWLAAAALISILIAAGVSFAAYTNQSHLRGTVRNRSSQSVRFTSNYMQSCASGTDAKNYAGRTVLFSEASKNADQITVEIEVYNYINGNTSLVSEKDITYDMTISLSGGASESTYTVTGPEGTNASDNNNTYVFSDQLLPGRKPNAHKYTVTFPGSDIDKLKITATAIPKDLSVTNKQILAAVIAPCTASTTAVFRCTGVFTDAGTGSPKDYDGYNYEVAITSGRATVTVSWKPDAVEIDPFFLEKLNARGAAYNISGMNAYTYDKSAGTLTFIMDQSTGAGDYLIPFYIVDRSKTEDLSWSEMESQKIISVSGSEIKDQ